MRKSRFCIIPLDYLYYLVKLAKLNKKFEFPNGHPSHYWPRSWLLNYSDLTIHPHCLNICLLLVDKVWLRHLEFWQNKAHQVNRWFSLNHVQLGKICYSGWDFHLKKWVGCAPAVNNSQCTKFSLFFIYFGDWSTSLTFWYRSVIQSEKYVRCTLSLFAVVSFLVAFVHRSWVGD